MSVIHLLCVQPLQTVAVRSITFGIYTVSCDSRCRRYVSVSVTKLMCIHVICIEMLVLYSVASLYQVELQVLVMYAVPLPSVYHVGL